MIPRFLIRNIKCCEFLLIHKAKKAVSISEKECPAGNSRLKGWLVFGLGKCILPTKFVAG